MKKILLVDDQREIRELLSKFFTLNGYEVESVTDGETAIRRIQEKKYDLVVSNFMMPDMDGVHLTKNLKRHQPSLLVMILSGFYGSEKFLEESGADAFIRKPLDLPRIKRVVEEMMNLRK